MFVSLSVPFNETADELLFLDKVSRHLADIDAKPLSINLLHGKSFMAAFDREGRAQNAMLLLKPIFKDLRVIIGYAEAVGDRATTPVWRLFGALPDFKE